MNISNASLNSNQLTAVSRLFSASVIKELSKSARSPLFARLMKEADLFHHFCDNEPIGHVFEGAFTLLKQRQNRHEYVYKSALTHKILLGTHSLNTASMISEFRVGDCKADAVILNGTGTVYEIKSERDSLERLSKQVTAYRKVFAKVNVITGANHLSGVKASVPDDVGIMVLSDRYRISTVREAVEQTDRIDPLAVLDATRSAEARAILKYMGIEVPQVPNTQLHEAMNQIFRGLDPASVHGAMVEVLKKTRSLAPLHEFVDALPNSLLAAGFSTKIKKSEHKNLLESIKTPIAIAKRWN